MAGFKRVRRNLAYDHTLWHNNYAIIIILACNQRTVVLSISGNGLGCLAYNFENLTVSYSRSVGVGCTWNAPWTQSCCL